MQKFCEVLRTCLDEKGYSQKWLAENVGTTEATISRCLNSIHTPSVELVSAMADALNVSVDYLLGRSPDPFLPSPRECKAYIIGNAFNRCTERDAGIIMQVLAEYLTDSDTAFLNSSASPND